MTGKGLFGDDAAFEKAFYAANDQRKFAQRRLFMLVGIVLYGMMGVLDPLMGGTSAAILLTIRVISVITMTIIWMVFVSTSDYRVREVALSAFAMTAIFSVLVTVVCARGAAADYYPFVVSAVQIFGSCLVVPQFRTMAVSCAVAYSGFWSTVHLGEASTTSLYMNAFLLTSTTFAVAVGAYTREALERDQMRKEQQLAAARDDALRMGEAAVRANEAKNHMLANVSHELRTPMNAIIGFSEAMKMELFGPIEQPKYVEYVTDIHRSGGILLSNINDLLDVARIEAGKMGWEETKFPVIVAMETAVKASRATLRDATVQIVWHDASEGASIRGDFDRLCQAIINVLNNAGKFSHAKGLIRMTFGRDGDGWAIRVRDSGCGIPLEDLQRIREPFAQVGPDGFSVTKGGLGLGLAITGEIIRRLDGEIVIDSALDEGTTVTFRLPADRITEVAQRLRA